MYSEEVILIYIIKTYMKDGHKTIEYIDFKNKYEFDMMKYYQQYLGKFKIFKILFNDVTDNYEILREILNEKKVDIRKAKIILLSFINNIKKFEEKSIKKFNDYYEKNLCDEIINRAHSCKEYNLIYCMRNYDEHISCPIMSIEESLDEPIKMFTNVGEIYEKLRQTGWVKLLKKQYNPEEIIDINTIIDKVYNVSKSIWKAIWKVIIENDFFLFKFADRLHRFHNRFESGDEENGIYIIYLSNFKDFKKIYWGVKIDILFIKEILLSKSLDYNNIDYKMKDIIIHDDVEFMKIKQTYDPFNKKFINQKYLASCLNVEDIEIFLKGDRKC